jgi:FAD/FMN-containing dehydrogenase
MSNNDRHPEFISESSNTNTETSKQVWGDILLNLQNQIQGDVVYDEDTLTKYSHDTSVFEIKPLAVIYPKNSLDIATIVKFVQDNKRNFPKASITPRSGGSCMTGGAIGEGFIMDVTRYLNSYVINADSAYVQINPGVFYRDFEPESLKHNLLMPVYPASKDLAAFGGMISNNCAGEKSLQHGQMRNFVQSLKVILHNGKEYDFKEISFDEVEKIIQDKDEFLAGIYRRTFHLIDQNYNFIKNAKPKTLKNSAGYALWEVMDKEKKTFNLAQLFTGAQGTLGIVTDAKIRLVPVKKFEKVITVFLPSWKKLPSVVNAILPYKPESLEVFDDTTLKLGLRFFPQIAKRVGKSLISFMISFIPEFFVGVRMLGLPKLIMIIEAAGETQEELNNKIKKIEEALRIQRVIFRTIPTKEEAEKYFVVRRESFNLLREKVKGKSTVPFVEDFCVNPSLLPEFLPKLLSILKKNKININIAGHAGEGNLHIIPLMDLKDEKNRKKIVPVAQEVYDLVISYGGTITAEHNDGIIRTPFLKDMYGERMILLFKEIKNIFDPNTIFNPGKKIDGTLEDIEKWMKRG